MGGKSECKQRQHAQHGVWGGNLFGGAHCSLQLLLLGGGGEGMLDAQHGPTCSVTAAACRSALQVVMDHQQLHTQPSFYFYLVECDIYIMALRSTPSLVLMHAKSSHHA